MPARKPDVSLVMALCRKDRVGFDHPAVCFGMIVCRCCNQHFDQARGNPYGWGFHHPRAITATLWLGNVPRHPAKG
jgi:hypothetical protein